MVRSDPITALAALVADVCECEDLDAFTSRWGRAESSRARSGGVRVLCGPEGAFKALEVRPWDENVTGLVDVEFRGEDAPLMWAEVRDRFGPFRDLPRLHGTGLQYGATATAAGKVADAYLLVTVTGGVVADLSVRRDPR